MNKTTFVPDPEANENTLMPSSSLTVYPSREVPGALSVMLVSNDENRMIQGGLRLTPEQVEGLLAEVAGLSDNDLFDLGYAKGYKEGEEEGQRVGYDDGYGEGDSEGWENGYALGFERGIEAGEEVA
jgi:hypothetical protein